jgi:hypothetical protein
MYAKIYSQGFYRNLFHIFLSFISFSMHFQNLYIFSEILQPEKKFEKGRNNAGSGFVPWLRGRS